jgi:predicted porin
MKTKIAAAIALSLLAGSTFAAPTFYGEIDASVDYLPEDNKSPISDKDVVEVSSNSSYLGVKGDEKLNDRLSAVYLAEWAFNADGEGTDWSARNRYVGLKDAKLGTVKVGVHDTPLKQLSSVVDTFNNYVANKADVTGIMTGETRLANVVVYESPALTLPTGAIKLNALLATGEDSGIAKGNGASKAAGRGLGDTWSASLVYDSPMFVAGVAYDKAVPTTFAGRGMTNATNPEVGSGVTGANTAFAAANTLRAIGRLNVLDNSLALKALYQTSEVEEKPNSDTDGATQIARAANIDKSDGWLVGAEYNIPSAKAWTIKAQYSANTTSFKDNSDDFDADQIMAGVDYAFSKQVKLYGYGGYLTLERGDFETKQPVVGTGLEFKF